MKKILLQLDVDPQPCSFDAVVAVATVALLVVVVVRVVVVLSLIHI